MKKTAENMERKDFCFLLELRPKIQGQTSVEFFLFHEKICSSQITIGQNHLAVLRTECKSATLGSEVRTGDFWTVEIRRVVLTHTVIRLPQNTPCRDFRPLEGKIPSRGHFMPQIRRQIWSKANSLEGI